MRPDAYHYRILKGSICTRQEESDGSRYQFELEDDLLLETNSDEQRLVQFYGVIVWTHTDGTKCATNSENLVLVEPVI